MIEIEPRVQAKVDLIVYRYGRDFLLKDEKDVEDILWEYDVLREDITEKILDRADIRARQNLRENLRQRNEKSWKDKVAKAEDNDLFNGDLTTRTPNEEDSTMKMKENEAREMLIEAGFNAGNWPAKKLLAVLNDPERLGEAKEPSGVYQDQFQAVCAALVSGKTIEIKEPKKPKLKKEESITADSSVEEQPTENVEVKIEVPVEHTDELPEEIKIEEPPEDSLVVGMSSMDAAYRVLVESEKPLSRHELIETMDAKGYWKTKKGLTPANTIAASIYMEIKKKGDESRFVKVERGMFTAKK